MNSTTEGMIDSRTVMSEAPTPIDLGAEIATADIKRPDGSSYSVITNVTILESSTEREDCLVFYAAGGVTVQQTANISLQLKTALLEAQPGKELIQLI